MMQGSRMFNSKRELGKRNYLKKSKTTQQKKKTERERERESE